MLGVILLFILYGSSYNNNNNTNNNNSESQKTDINADEALTTIFQAQMIMLGAVLTLML